MPSNLQSVLLDPNSGLIPYLDATLDGQYRRLQVRSWSFDSTSDQRSGFRVREARSESDGAGNLFTTYSIVIGRIFPITEGINGSIAAADLQVSLDKTIQEWSQCKAIGLRSEILEFNGAIFPRQDASKAWFEVVVRSFEMTVLS